MDNLTKDYKKIDIKDGSKPSLFVRFWKDPVGSKIMSVLIIAILTFIYSLIQTICISSNLDDFIIKILTFKIQLYWILILVALSILLIMGINYYIKSRRLLPTDLILNMKIGEFRYVELINALSSHHLTTPESLKKYPTDKISILDCFILYARKITDGVYAIIEDGDQEKFLNNTVCPILEAYGLVMRKKESNPRPNSSEEINFYYMSDDGRKLYQALQVYRGYIGDIMEEW